MKREIKIMVDIALFSSLAFVLDFTQGMICNLFPVWVNGGSVGISMVAIFVLSLKYGIPGLFGGLLTGLLTMIGGIYISPLAAEGGFFSVLLQVGLDYYLGWTLLGVAGLFAKKFQQEEGKKKVLIALLACSIGGLLKYLCHFLAGMIYWPNEDVTSNFLYSLIYNGSYMIPSIILSAIIIVIIIKKQPKLLDSE